MVHQDLFRHGHIVFHPPVDKARHSAGIEMGYNFRIQIAQNSLKRGLGQMLGHALDSVDSSARGAEVVLGAAARPGTGCGAG